MAKGSMGQSFKERRNIVDEKINMYARSRPLSGKCALLVIDFQRFFTHPDSHAFLEDASSVEGNIRILLDACRGVMPTIFTRHAHGSEGTGALGRWWRDPLMDTSPMSSLSIEPMDGDYVVVKNRYDAFHNTELDSILNKLGVEEVLLAGVMTDLCVDTTARSAFVRDYDVTIVHDACCTQGFELHLAALLTLAHGFAVVKNTETIVEEIG